MDSAGSQEIKEREIIISVDGVELKAIYGLPEKAIGVVAFAHGSGSGRLSPRNNFVARILQKAGIVTLLADLLEEREANDRRKVFDIDLLTDRLIACTRWLRAQAEQQGLRLGYFGASTGAAAALQAAAREPEGIAAIVSRGGRPDLSLDSLHLVQSPTLLIVGGEDSPVILLNEEAYDRLLCPKHLAIVPGATHLFEEPGALETVAELARDWFVTYLPPKT